MKADIEQLLKEVSGQLQQLQSQLRQEQQPQAGRGTDPNLYGAPTPLDPLTGQPIGIQLTTDTAPATEGRSTSGTGQPTRTVATEAPKAKPEAVQLSEQPVEERAATRQQPVPPEYQPVFDRLHRRTTP